MQNFSFAFPTQRLLVLGILGLVVLQGSMALAETSKTKASPPPSKYEKRLEACGIKSGDVQAEPYFKDGQLAGFRYTQIRAGSSYSRAGFKPGDVLVEQNGITLRAPEDIVVAFEAAKEGEPQVSTVLRAEKLIKFRMACDLGRGHSRTR